MIDYIFYPIHDYFCMSFKSATFERFVIPTKLLWDGTSPISCHFLLPIQLIFNIACMYSNIFILIYIKLKRK